MQVRLKINGRDASPNNMGSAIEDAILAKAKERMPQKLSNLRCPDHNQAPKLGFEGDSLKNIKDSKPCLLRMRREEAQRTLCQSWIRSPLTVRPSQVVRMNRAKVALDQPRCEEVRKCKAANYPSGEHGSRRQGAHEPSRW